jgi:dihydrofolate reductase
MNPGRVAGLTPDIPNGRKGEPTMRKLVAVTHMTLDGVMQAPGGPEEDPSGGFEIGGWSFGYFDDVLGQQIGEAMASPFDLVLGRRTYEIFAAHWPHDEGPIADRLNAATKYVASRTLKSVDWASSRLIEGDVADEVGKLKEEDGPELQVYGSSELLQTLLANGLVDEFRLWIFPVVAGSGKRLFGDGAVPAGLELTGSSTSNSGVIIATYEPAGEIKKGSFAFEEPTEAEVQRRQALED